MITNFKSSRLVLHDYTLQYCFVRYVYVHKMITIYIYKYINKIIKQDQNYYCFVSYKQAGLVWFGWGWDWDCS